MKSIAARSALALGTAALVALVASCGDSGSSGACAGKAGVAGTRTVTLQSGGLERSFLLTVPESALASGRPVPLVVVYHGVFANAEIIQALTGFPEKAAAEGFITAAGDGIGDSWNAGVCCSPASDEQIDDVGFTRDLVAAIGSEYCIDPARTYATGFSNGAAMVFRLACETADLFAAFAPVAGSVALPSCTPSEPRPIEVINNVSDPVVPFLLGEISFGDFLALNACSAARESTQPAAGTSCEIAPECAAGSTTTLCAVENLNHQWPGGASNPNTPFKATDAVWEFFAAHPG
jgi:polyhydroxybutyrate depolymerase